MDLVVSTGAGRVRGVIEKGNAVFKGVPYASPPIGSLRFSTPQPAESWDGIRDATGFGFVAPQNPVPGTFQASAITGLQSEDCLTLNVWTPDCSPTARLPVMVHIHGGGFVIGAGSQPGRSEGTTFARDGVVCVTFNYRLGALGFLHTTGDGSGNFAILDQIAALEWVQENIKVFGGDPGNVTVFGVSAGGISVATLLGTPRASGLFRRAIAQSGGGSNYLPVETAERVALRFAQILGVNHSDIDALRSAHVGRLLAAQRLLISEALYERDSEHRLDRCHPGFIDALEGTATSGGLPRFGLLGPSTLLCEAEGLHLPFEPMTGGDVLPQPAVTAVEAGSAKGIDLLVGNMREEFHVVTARAPDGFGLEPPAVRECLERTMGRFNVASNVARKTYEICRPGSSAADLIAAVEADVSFRIPAIRLAEAQSPHAPTYMYLFAWKSPGAGGRIGACHGLDVPFVWDSLHAPGMAGVVGEDPPQGLADAVHGAWVKFSKTGVPGHSQLPRWPTYDVARRSTMQLDDPAVVIDDPMAETRQLWERIPLR